MCRQKTKLTLQCDVCENPWKRSGLSKKASYLNQNPDDVLNLDNFGEILASVYVDTDKIARAGDKLDMVYHGNESLDKYIERFTSLVAEVEVPGNLSVGEKIHRFRKGLREDLRKAAGLDPTTGLPYADITA
jgi:Retrotransposon gag protein